MQSSKKENENEMVGSVPWVISVWKFLRNGVRKSEVLEIKKSVQTREGPWTMKRLIYNKARFRLGIWSEEKCLSWQLPFRMLMLMLKDTSSYEKIRWWWRGSSTHPSGIDFILFFLGLPWFLFCSSSSWFCLLPVFFRSFSYLLSLCWVCFVNRCKWRKPPVEWVIIVSSRS